MMRHLTVLVALFITGVTFSARAEPEARRTLGELITLARARAGQVGVAQAELSVAKTQKDEALRLWSPKGEFTYLITGVPNVYCQAPEGLSPLPGQSDKDFRTRNCVNTVSSTGKDISIIEPSIAGVGMQMEINLTQPVFTFGKIEYAIRAANSNIDARQAGIEAARREAELNVVRAYWGLKTARASRDTVKEARDEVAPWLKKIEDALDKGDAKYSETDVQRLKVALTQVDLLLANLDRGATVAKAALRAIIGENSEIDDSELSPVEIVEHPLPYYLDAAQSARPELRQLDAGVSALQAMAKVRRSEMLPDLAVVLGFNFRYAPTIEDSTSAFQSHANQVGFSLFAGLRQPLDIISKWSRMKHAEADTEVMSAQRRLARDGVAFEIDRAYADLTETHRRLELAERGQRTARGWLTAVRQNMDLGTAEPRDLVDSAKSYFEMRISYFQAIMDFNITTAQLRRASGMDVTR